MAFVAMTLARVSIFPVSAKRVGISAAGGAAIGALAGGGIGAGIGAIAGAGAGALYDTHQKNHGHN